MESVPAGETQAAAEEDSEPVDDVFDGMLSWGAGPCPGVEAAPPPAPAPPEAPPAPAAEPKWCAALAKEARFLAAFLLQRALSPESGYQALRDACVAAEGVMDSPDHASSSGQKSGSRSGSKSAAASNASGAQQQPESLLADFCAHAVGVAYIQHALAWVAKHEEACAAAKQAQERAAELEQLEEGPPYPRVASCHTERRAERRATGKAARALGAMGDGGGAEGTGARGGRGEVQQARSAGTAGQESGGTGAAMRKFCRCRNNAGGAARRRASSS